MNSMLVITTLDYHQEANQRIHHVVNLVGKHIQKVVVMHFALSNRRSLGQWIKHSFPFSVRESRQGKIRLYRVNPLGNFPENFGKGLMRFPDTRSAGTFFHGFVSRVLNLLGLYKSLSTICCYLLTYLLKLRREHFDIVLVEGPWEGLVGVCLKASRKAKALVYQDIDFIAGDLSSKFRRRLTERVELFCMSKADLRISSGKLLQELRQRKLGKEVIFLPNGVDCFHWAQAQKKIPHRPTLAYIGNIIDWTGLHWVLDTLPSVLDKIPQLRLIIIGRGHPQYESKLREKVSHARLQSAVNFVGFVPYADLPAYLREADIGLATFEPIPLLRYAFPLKVVEYMAAGLPVIASNETESARLIQEYDVGISVTYGSTRQFSEAILHLLKNPEIYRFHADNAKKHSLAFSWERLMDLQYHYLVGTLGETSPS
jgi:glycosyltransferase involved in cell wall biosynthesis